MFGNSSSFDLLLSKTKHCLLRNFGASRKTTFCIFGNFPDEKIRPQMHHQPRYRPRRVHLTHLHFFSHALPPSKYRNTLFSGTEFRAGFISGRWNDLGRGEANYSGSFLGEMFRAGLRVGPNILGRAIERVIKEPQQRRKNGIRPTRLKHEIQQTVSNFFWKQFKCNEKLSQEFYSDGSLPQNMLLWYTLLFSGPFQCSSIEDGKRPNFESIFS